MSDPPKEEKKDEPVPEPAESEKKQQNQEKTGRGRGGRGRGSGRGGRGRGRGRNRHNPRTTTTKAVKFKGNTDGMKGNVFQCHSEEQDKKQFLKTVGVLEEYMNKNFEYPGDVATICKSFEVTDIEMPEEITPEEYSSNIAKKMMYEADMKDYMRRRKERSKNLRAIYAIVWGQCSPMMQSKLESKDDYETKSTECDCVWLLKEIRAITHQFEETTIGYVSLFDAWEAFYKFRQGQDQSLHEYLKEYQALVQVLEHYQAPIGEGSVYEELEMAHIKAMNKKANETTIQAKCKSAAKQRFIGIAFLQSAHQKRYGGLWSDLKNNFTRGLDQYPRDLIGAYNMLLNYSPPPGQRSNNTQPTTENQEEVSAMTFLQNAGPIPGTDGITRPKILCYNCQQQGHYADVCPGEECKTGTQMLQVGTGTETEVEESTERNDEEAEEDMESEQGSSTEEDDEDDEESSTSDHDDEEDDDEPYESEFTFLMNTPAYQMQQSGHNIPDTWILLDSQSTVSVFKNRRYLTNIKQSKKILRVHTNGGTQVSNHVGKVRNFGYVWFNPNSLANILSMAEVRKVCRITMDTSVEAAMIVHRKDGSEMKFREYNSGLYYFDVAEKGNSPKHSRSEDDGYLFLNTVADNKARFTRRDVTAADRARVLYRRLHYPGEQHYERLLGNNLVRNCPVTPHDAKRALVIYGKDVAATQGRTVKRANKGIPNEGHIEIPGQILEDYGTIRLFADIFWVNGTPYFHTVSEHIKFRTVAPIKNRSRRTLVMETQAVINLYRSRGFEISTVEADQEFSCMEYDLLPTTVNVADADDHVHEVERSIRVIKERTRCIVQALPFRRIPKLMARSAIEAAHKALNQFPTENGASDHMSPLTIVTGRPLPNYNDLKLDFGSYVQVFEANDPTNTTKARTTGAIVLNPTGNAQGGYHFMSLTTGRRLARQQWTEIPMPDGVIERVEQMAEEEEQPLLDNAGPNFEWRPGVPLDEANALDDAELENDNREPDWGNVEEAEYEDEQQAEEDDDSDYGDEDYEDHREAESLAEEAMDEADALNEQPSEDEEEMSDEDTEGEDPADFEHDGEATEDEATTPGQEEDTENGVGPEETQANGRVLRPNRTRGYGHRLDHQMDRPESGRSYGAQYLQNSETKAKGKEHNGTKTKTNTKRKGRTNKKKKKLKGKEQKKQEDDVTPKEREKHKNEPREAGDVDPKEQKRTSMMQYIVGFIMTQMSASAGIRKHGKVAIEALFQEFLQLHNREVFEGKLASQLTKAQKRAALKAISVIKEKRCGKVKGRTVADGRPQRTLYEKHETASPTVSTDALMLSLIIDAMESRDVGIADVTGAYLNADMDDFTLLKLEGEAVRIMCEVSGEYKQYVTKERGKEVLYLQLKKALYGCVKSALLWYELFSGTLEKMGFEINPYDNCVANMEIEGSQCTIVWYVDDTKVSHKNPEVVSEVIKKIEKQFGKMSVTRGTEHVFLGMNITMNEDKTATIDMSDYVKEAIEESGAKLKSEATSPAKKDLFEVNEESPRLPKEKAELFHSVVAKLLYVSKRARLDIQLAVSFLCTRVAKCTEEDWEKLVRVLEYLNGTVDDRRKIGADDIRKMGTWVDAAFSVHMDMKSHTGAAISFGTGAAMSRSAKQKLNTKSSTEAELVGASDYLTFAIWAKLFLEAQGYELSENIFYQDNESAIRFEKNGRRSCGQNSRHIDIRYFFIKDRLETDKFRVVHCPTEKMVADFFTKPLQGSLFRKLREVIMGRAHMSSLDTLTATAPKERVEKNKKNVVRIDAAQRKPVEPHKGEKATYADVVRIGKPKAKRLTIEK